MLTPEHAKKLGRLFVGGPASFSRYKDAATDEEARRALDRIVADNEPFIASVVRSLKDHGLLSPQASVVELSDADLLQAGRRGYAKAIERFDPAKGALPKYAKDWIRNEVQRTAAKDATIHCPEQTRLPKAALDRMEQVETREGRPATAADLADLNVTPERLETWRTLPTVHSIHDLPLGMRPLEDRMASEDPSPEELVALRELACCVDAMPPRQRELMRLLYWESFPLEGAADELGITTDEAADLRDEALAELHAQLS